MSAQQTSPVKGEKLAQQEELLIEYNLAQSKQGLGELCAVLKDAHGNMLADGDCVILIKDLPLKGAQVLKGGSKSKPIRLVGGDHEIDCKVDGIAVGLKACFVKKA